MQYIDFENLPNHTVSQRGRKNIRSVKEIEDLSGITKVANQEEEERVRRIENVEAKFEAVAVNQEYQDQLILDYDFNNHVPLVSVEQSLASKLKNHQKEGVKFMWTACYESLDQIKKSKGSGCVLAHCMGLGKTFQVITLIHTLLAHKETRTSTVLICCPKNTLLNWVNEFRLWITSDVGRVNIHNPTRHEDYQMRLYELNNWHANGGVCIINYELFRILLEDGRKDSKLIKFKKRFYEYLCDPGPDLIICDEGHVLKNEETKLSKVMNQIRTSRRIVLTGSPMQNNLNEYYCMIQFVKPYLLGTHNEFLNMFANPILNGQYENSLYHDVRLMKERSHILHKKLRRCVQRFDVTLLRKFMPEKQEYVILISLTDAQVEMYKFYMENYSAKGDPNWKTQATQLFADYQSLQRIWTHPFTLKQYEEKHEKDGKSKNSKKSKKRKRKSFDDNDDEDSSDSDGFRWTRYPLSWWTRFATIDDLDDARQSNKLIMLLNILQKCEEEGEKLLVFSGSLYSLRLIEHFLKKINRTDFEEPSLCNMISSWEEGEDYLILTGQTSAKDRDSFCKRFNNKNYDRLRLFLISTKAGGIGINLTAANRAVLFDVSWNPSHDIQSIFRIYRLGQTKPCFVYRLVASGTMEEIMYERQVAKQSISHRVIDEKQTARHFTKTELLELYQFEPHREHKIRIKEPEDFLLQKVLKEVPYVVNGILEHDTLLQHQEEEELKDMEKEVAWTAFNNNNSNNNNTSNNNSNNSSKNNSNSNNNSNNYNSKNSNNNNNNNNSSKSNSNDNDGSNTGNKVYKIRGNNDYDDTTAKEEFIEDVEQDAIKLTDDSDTIDVVIDLNQDDMYSPGFENIISNKDDSCTLLTNNLISKSECEVLQQEKVSSGRKGTLTLSNARVNQKPKVNQVITIEDGTKENKNHIIDLTVSPISNVILQSSDSEDSFFVDPLKSASKKKKFSKTPLKSWGRRHSKHYGSPDRD